MGKFRFHHYAWGLLFYNLLVILGGAFVRATRSGDGCGNSWPDCHGAVIPDFAQLKTVIEYCHRASSGVVLLTVVGLAVWAFYAFPKGHPARWAAASAFGMTVVEALIGAGLVLFRWVAHDQSAGRAVVMPIHLVATFLLLMAITLAAWWGGGGRKLQLRGQGGLSPVLLVAMLAAMLVGVTGALTALGDTLFPADSLMEGLRQDLNPSSHFLVSFRMYHPLIAMSVGLYMVLAAGLAMHLRPAPEVKRLGQLVVLMFLVQMGAGFLNLGLLAPIWMQLVHLLLADLFWVLLVLLTAAAMGEGVPQVELNAPIADEAGTPEVAGVRAAQTATAMRATWKEYIALTKPRVISLLLFTTLTAMFIAAGVEGKGAPSFWLCLATGLGLYMSAGAANAINMVLERDLDLRMGRTAKRPTVTEAVPPRAALQFALILTLVSFGLLWWVANLISAMLALAGLSFYVIVYTLLLKRRTWANIVIGGAAGAFPPLVGWAAVTGDLSPLAWVLFGIIFLWTPVHFWALALMIKEDYARAGVPMLPVVRGDRATVAQIAHYTLLTVAISVVPLLLQGKDGKAAVGVFYLGAAVLLNGVLVARSVQLYRNPDCPHARSLFKYSMVYLALLFLAMAVDPSHWS